MTRRPIEDYIAAAPTMSRSLRAPDVALVRALDAFQAATGVAGDVLELNYRRGEAAVLLAYLPRGSERLVVCDESPALASDAWREFESTFLTYHDDLPTLVHRVPSARFRIAQLDWPDDPSSRPAAVVAATDLLLDGGVAVFDASHSSLGTIDVIAAKALLDETSKDLVPVACSPSRFYAVRGSEGTSLIAHLESAVRGTGGVVVERQSPGRGAILRVAARPRRHFVQRARRAARSELDRRRARPKAQPPIDRGLDVLVTCRPRLRALSNFPQVRGFYLAKHLRQLGLRAEFRELPLPGVEPEVVIWSDYQMPLDHFAQNRMRLLREVGGGRLFCMTAYSIGERDHFSRQYCEWFAERGGVLCHGLEGQPAPYEHVIGVGVDTDVVPSTRADPDIVLFDFALTGRLDYAARFDPRLVEAVRRALPEVRLAGSGPRDARIRRLFDVWVPYGQSHPTFVAAALQFVFAFVPGGFESLGLTVAEAQVAGATVVSGPSEIKDWVASRETRLLFRRTDPDSLVDALREARRRDPAQVAAEARRRFDYTAVARRTCVAIGLSAAPVRRIRSGSGPGPSG